MATEKEILNLFDLFWFEKLIFMNKQEIHVEEEDDDEEEEEEEVFLLEESKKLARMATSLHVRSLSCDQILSSDSISFSSDSESPNSFLFAAPKLQTILSGKEVIEFEDQLPPAAAEAKRGERMEVTIEERESCIVKDVRRRRRRERRRIYGCGGGCSSKSLSDLEFEELKGFMDLGFVFSEEDKEDSSLVSIIPGLQRLGRKKGSSVEDHDSSYENDHHEAAAAEAAIDGDDDDDDDKSVVEICRPYLSEAWDVMDDDDDDDEDERKNEENALNAALVNWRIPAVVNDIDMKDQLRFWAHSVASAVR